MMTFYYFLTLDNRRREIHLPEFGLRIIRLLFELHSIYQYEKELSTT